MAELAAERKRGDHIITRLETLEKANTTELSQDLSFVLGQNNNKAAITQLEAAIDTFTHCDRDAYTAAVRLINAQREWIQTMENAQ